MSKFSLIFYFLLSIHVSGQDSTSQITSFFLTEIPEQNADYLKNVPDEYINTYLLDTDSLSALCIWKDSIIIKKTMLFTLSMTEIIDNPDWYLLNGKLHGVKKGEGLTFIEENDTILAAIEIDYPIWKSTDRNELVFQLKDQIRIFQQVDGYWMFYLINLNEEEIEIANFDHDPVITSITSWKNTKETTLNGYKTYISSPTRAEFEALLNNENAFENTTTYTAIYILD